MDSKKQLLLVTSENLLINPKHREKLGAKVDSMTESLSIIQDGLKNIKQGCHEGVIKVGPQDDKLPDIGEFSCSTMSESDVNSLQLNVKLFLKTYDIELAKDAVKRLVDALGKLTVRY